MAIDGLVPGRECGDCTVCCIVPTIDDPEIQKKPGLVCRHCDRGCRIYPNRPKPCREFHCAWRMLAALGPDWRPDLSGVFGLVDTALIDGSPQTALTLILIRDADRAIAQSGFIAFVSATLLADRPLFLGLKTAPGHRPLRARLAGPGARAAAQRGPDAVAALLREALAFLRRQPLSGYALKHSGNDTGLPA